jgi:hypothetical protein
MGSGLAPPWEVANAALPSRLVLPERIAQALLATPLMSTVSDPVPVRVAAHAAPGPRAKLREQLALRTAA